MSVCASSSGDRVAHSECEGRGFDSRLAHQEANRYKWPFQVIYSDFNFTQKCKTKKSEMTFSGKVQRQTVALCVAHFEKRGILPRISHFYFRVILMM